MSTVPQVSFVPSASGEQKLAIHQYPMALPYAIMTLSPKADSVTAFSKSAHVSNSVYQFIRQGFLLLNTLLIPVSHCIWSPSSQHHRTRDYRVALPRSSRRAEVCLPHHCSGNQPKAQHAHICSSKLTWSQMCLRDSGRERTDWWKEQGIIGE